MQSQEFKLYQIQFKTETVTLLNAELFRIGRYVHLRGIK